MKGFLLDTHIWVRLQTGQHDTLPETFLAEVQGWQRTGEAHISPISAWELGLLAEHDLLDLGMSVERFVEEGTFEGGLRLLPLTVRTLVQSTHLPGEIHRDPADRILVAAAREYGLTLVTRDKLLLQYAKQGHLNARKP